MKADLFTFVGAFSRGLDTLSHILTKGAEFAKETGVSEAEMLDWKLAPDMFGLRQQAHVVLQFATQWPARAAGLDVPAGPEGESSLADLQAMIAAAKAKLAALTPEQFAGRDDQPVTINIGQEMTFPVGQWLPGFAMPNFYFHLSMAYAILRQKGVALGKRDFFAGGL